MCLAFAGYQQRPDLCRMMFTTLDAVTNFPRRPDANVFNETIPLFFIGRNENGFWVAREAEARTGGIFLFKRSALRFARKNSTSVGCATMFVAEPVELDVENQGSPFVALLAAAVGVAARRAPLLAVFIGMAVAEWQKLVAQVSRAVAGERRNRKAIEKELFRGQYTLSSKNDDDLPIP
jgi:hypothetical protein